jgi:hypothetical protein
MLIQRLLLFELTKSTPIPTVSAAPRLTRSISAAANMPASNGNIRKSTCRLEIQVTGEHYASKMPSYIVRRSSLRFGSSVDSNLRSGEWSLGLSLASASKAADCMTTWKGKTVMNRHARYLDSLYILRFHHESNQGSQIPVSSMSGWQVGTVLTPSYSHFETSLSLFAEGRRNVRTVVHLQLRRAWKSSLNDPTIHSDEVVSCLDSIYINYREPRHCT